MIRDILVRPGRFFLDFAGNVPVTKTFFFSYGMPLMTLGAAGRMVRVMNQFVREGIAPGGAYLSGTFLVSLTAYILSVWLGARIIARLAGAFGSEKDAGKSMLLCIIAYTPLMLAQLLAALGPVMEPVWFVGLIYAAFVFGKGAGPLLRTPAHKTLGFTLIGFFVLFGISALSIHVLSALFIFGEL